MIGGSDKELIDVLEQEIAGLNELIRDMEIEHHNLMSQIQDLNNKIEDLTNRLSEIYGIARDVV